MLGELISVGLGVGTLIGVVEEALDGAPEGTAYRNSLGGEEETCIFILMI